MSTSPIGTRVPTLSPNSIIRAGIPLSDDFNATDVAVTVESLIPTISSGTWTPTITTDYEGSIFYSALYTRVGNSVSFYISFALENNTGLINSGNTTFTPPDGLLPSTDLIGIMSFNVGLQDANVTASLYSITSNGLEIIHSMTNTVANGSYGIIIQGTYLLA
jgi:hypothetical protein